MNAAQLAREPGAVAALLALLEAPPAGTADFYARYHALQALKGLAAAAPGQLQEARGGLLGRGAGERGEASAAGARGVA